MERPKNYLRKRRVALRYDTSERSVDRWCRDGRLPKPKYNGSVPLWSEAELDAHDRAALKPHSSKLHA
jgi:predicted DNA-binding transcriptional regulator AlpA